MSCTSSSTSSSAFEDYDWKNDQQWQTILRNIYIPPGPDYERLLNKRKCKYYKSNVDSDYVFVQYPNITNNNFDNSNTQDQTEQPTYTSSSSSSSSFSSTSEPFSSSTSSTSSTSSSSSSSSSTPTGGNIPSGSNSRYGSGFGVSLYLSYLQLLLHLLIVLHGPLVSLPLLGYGSQSTAYSRLLKCSLFAHALHLYRAHRPFKWNAMFAQQLFQDEASHFLFYSLILNLSSYSILAIAPLVIRSALFVSRAFVMIIPNRFPSLFPSVIPILERFNIRYTELMSTAALLEVMYAILSVIQLITFQGNLLLTMSLWQYLRLRYMLSSDSKVAFSNVNARITSFLCQPFIPVIIRTLYYRVVTFAYSFVDPAQLAASQQNATGGISSIMSRCSVM